MNAVSKGKVLIRACGVTYALYFLSRLYLFEQGKLPPASIALIGTMFVSIAVGLWTMRGWARVTALVCGLFMVAAVGGNLVLHKFLADTTGSQTSSWSDYLNASMLLAMGCFSIGVTTYYRKEFEQSESSPG